MKRIIGFFVSFSLAISAYVVWAVRELNQWAIFAEEPSSFVRQWLRVLVGMGIVGGGGLIIAVLLALIWKPWKE